MPLLLIPHVAIPAGLVYLLYLDHQETISRVRVETPDLELGLGLGLGLGPEPSFQVLDTDLNVIKQEKEFFIPHTQLGVPSPMSIYIKKNKYALNDRAHMHIWNMELCRMRQTPMRDLASSAAFQTELHAKVETIYALRDWQTFYKNCYNHLIVRRITQQHGLVTSKLAKCIRDNIWYSFIAEELRTYEHTMFMDSPMHKLATNPEFYDWIYGEQLLRVIDRYFRETTPMHILAVKEQANIVKMARQMSFSRVVRPSKMYNFISNLNNRMAIVYFGSRNMARMAEMTSSPLRVWSHNNKYQLSARATEYCEIKTLRTQTLQNITGLLARNYGTIYRKHTLREYRQRNGIPEIQFLPNCASYANIVFPIDMQLADRFLADSNLDGFITQTIYTDRNHYQSYAVSLLTSASASQPSIDDLTDAAQTFKNISHLTHEATQVQILSDSTKISFPSPDPTVQAKRYIEFYFVCRDRTDFRSSDFKTCNARITEFLKRFPALEYKVGFVGRWLSDTMVLQVTGPYNDIGIGKYNNVVTDLIRVVNLVKGIIFQKVIDRTIWLQLN